jgi:hypothetical protein
VAHPGRHLDVVVPRETGFDSDRADDSLDGVDAELDRDLAKGRLGERTVDGQHDSVLGARHGDQSVANGELPRQDANRAHRDVHDLVAGRGKEPIDRSTVGVHLVFGEIAELEEHGIEIAGPHDLLLNRMLNPFDGDHLIANEK